MGQFGVIDMNLPQQLFLIHLLAHKMKNDKGILTLKLPAKVDPLILFSRLSNHSLKFISYLLALTSNYLKKRALRCFVWMSLKLED
jgi:hypothetical protein